MTRVQDREHNASRRLATPVLLLLVGGFALAQNDIFRASVAVDLVVLQVTIHDRKGHSVGTLAKEDFAVYEDEALQSVRLFRHEDTPVTIGLVVDHSGSMREKLNEVAAAARTFVAASNPEDQVFVVNFNEKVSLGLPDAMPFSNSAGQLTVAIGSAPAEGMTALYDAIVRGLDVLRKGERDKKVLVVISDGGDNASQANLDGVLSIAAQSNAAIYTIGVFDPDDPDRNPKVLRRLAQETGGEAFFASNLHDTVDICQRIARDLREQYTLGYTSPDGKPGVYHTIRVVARPKEPGKLTVRTRAGYMTGDGGK
jgi:Ca-activated chloride channel homolog